jgi:hypothetical protein
MKTKCCSKCKEEKPLSEFWKDRRRLDGKHGSCRECSTRATRAWIERTTTDEQKAKKKSLLEDRATIWHSETNKKRCSHCREYKATSSFGERHGVIKSWCRPCEKVDSLERTNKNREQINDRKREIYAERKEKTGLGVSQRKKEWRERPEHIQQCRVRSKKYYNENPELMRERSRKYASENREKVNLAGRIYSEANKERISERSKEQRAELVDSYIKVRLGTNNPTKELMDAKRTHLRITRHLREMVKTPANI